MSECNTKSRPVEPLGLCGNTVYCIIIIMLPNQAIQYTAMP
jgi:hypothetical protein